MNATFKHGSVAEFDQMELAIVMLESAMRLERPPGMTALEALESMEPDARALWLRAAAAALQYFEHAINNASPIQ
ncbi:MAG TPA: hypothetical protein VEW06_06325 [Xanthobacteraceae bacterium]|nr:hypothetical protein [Xanthobacteraceae bacterium]